MAVDLSILETADLLKFSHTVQNSEKKIKIKQNKQQNIQRVIGLNVETHDWKAVISQVTTLCNRGGQKSISVHNTSIPEA